MKAAIIDDLAACRGDIRECLNRYPDENYAGEAPVIEDFESGEEFLFHFAPEAYDIIFIDQYMDGLSGMDTAEKIREKDELVAVVFVTTSLDHAVESFGVRACGYLVKPLSYGKFKRTMELARLVKIRNARFLRVEKSKILLREILWCGQDGHYVEIHTEKRGTGRLAPYPQFLTCYKGCIVNMERAPFSARDRKKIETLFDEYTFQREREDGLE